MRELSEALAVAVGEERSVDSVGDGSGGSFVGWLSGSCAPFVGQAFRLVD